MSHDVACFSCLTTNKNHCPFTTITPYTPNIPKRIYLLEVDYPACWFPMLTNLVSAEEEVKTFKIDPQVP